MNEAMTAMEMMIRGEALFRARRIEIVSVDNLRAQIKRFDETMADVEMQASDRRKMLVQRLGDAEVRLVGAQMAIKYYIVEAAEVIKVEMKSDCIDCERRLAEAAADAAIGADAYWDAAREAHR